MPQPFYWIETPTRSLEQISDAENQACDTVELDQISTSKNGKEFESITTDIWKREPGQQFKYPDHPPRYRFAQCVDRWWVFQLLAWLVCASCLIAIVAILQVKGDESRTDWMFDINPMGSHPPKRVSLTINSVVSIFSTIIKSVILVPIVAGLNQLKWMWFRNDRCLIDYELFSSAAQGPSGSLLLLWSLRGRHLACLGAFVTVLILGLDFSLQTLIAYGVEPVKVGTALMPTASTYLGGSSSQIDRDMLGAIADGVYADITPLSGLPAAISDSLAGISRDHLDVTPTCPTGNCTWPIYTSLGVCSQCFDVSHQVDTSCSTYNTWQIAQAHKPVLIPTYQCSYTLPNGLRLGGRHNWNDSLFNSNISSATANSINFRHMRNPLAVVSKLNSTWLTDDASNVNASGNQFTFDSIKHLRFPSAIECGIYFCALKYNGVVQSGKLYEQVLETFTNSSGHMIPDSIGQDYLMINPPASFFHNTSGPIEPSGSGAFSVQYRGFAPVASLLRKIFVGAAYSSAQGTVVSSTSNVAALAADYNFQQMSDLISNLALSMTTDIRTRASELDTAAMIRGGAYQDLPHVQARWAWLTLPVLLLVATLIFLIATMIQSHRQNEVLWKSCGLGSFYHPLTEEALAELGDVTEPWELERAAKQLWVRREATGKGEKLVLKRRELVTQ